VINNLSDISTQLSAELLSRGTHFGDRFELVVENKTLGPVKLKDYGNAFHVAFKHPEHFNNPLDFYNSGNIPILGISSKVSSEGTTFAQIFRPCDISRKGSGTMYLSGLEAEFKDSTDIIATLGFEHLVNPLENTTFMNLVLVILGKG
jgi:hypothetical protein